MGKPDTQPPILPAPELSVWAQTLQHIAAKPLEFCEDFPTIARRFEAWWAQDLLDRPVFIATANTNPSRPITRRLELLDQPDMWFQAKFADMVQLRRVGDALPAIRVDFGPVLLAALFGGKVTFGDDTRWTQAFISDDWSNAPVWTFGDDNHWWTLLETLMQRVVEEATGRYLVCTPDLGGSGDVLLNLRGSAQLCLDVIDQPQRIREALGAIHASWLRAFTALYRRAMKQSVGLIHWLGIWSNQPYLVPACDFNSMIGRQEFESIFLPDIIRQAATIGRAVFHLDGPGAARHIDALLDAPEIQAIQFTPGAGTPSALAWVDMLRRIQQCGRSLLILCPPEEVIPLSEALRSEGLAILIDTQLAPAALDDLLAQLFRRYAH